MLSFTAAAAERHESRKVGRWQYGCVEDHKNPYGEVLNTANCWMMICERGHSDVCLYILEVRNEGVQLSPVGATSDCTTPPHKAAVDGVRIDNLSGLEQLTAIIAGKTIIREVENIEAPGCEIKDVEWSLDGAKNIWELLKKLNDKEKYVKWPE